MKSSDPAAARAEWARYWSLPFVAAIGYSASGLHVYSIGAFIQPIQDEFGWTRAQVLSGAALVSAVVALASVPLGLLIDRFGPRRIGLFGVLLIGSAFALLSTATGSLANWWILWIVVALCCVPVQGSVWTSAVATRFNASRGLALAITLCGAASALFVLPVLATLLIGQFGWRQAMMTLGLGWAAVLFPLLFFFFRGARDVARAKDVGQAVALSGISMREALREPAFYKLCLACGLFNFCILAIVVNFPPILTAKGMAPLAAAGAASLVGIFSVVGRLCTGAVLDRAPARVVGMVAFIMPIPALGLLLWLSQVGPVGGFAAAVLCGLTLGAEMDVVVYIATRRFGLKAFGAIQGGLLSAIAVGSATGPLSAGAVFDHFGSYGPFLIGAAAAMLVSAVMIGSIRERPTDMD